MSPRLGLTVTVTPPAEVRIREAAAAAGVLLRPGGYGVEWRPFQSHWEGVEPFTLNLTGAFVLHEQPDGDDENDPSMAAALALGVKLGWMMGLEDGFAGDSQSPAWTTSVTAREYMDGYHLGATIRREVTP